MNYAAMEQMTTVRTGGLRCLALEKTGGFEICLVKIIRLLCRDIDELIETNEDSISTVWLLRFLIQFTVPIKK